MRSAWGANACASVFASLGVVVSRQLGFKATRVLAALLYWIGYGIWRTTATASQGDSRSQV